MTRFIGAALTLVLLFVISSCQAPSSYVIQHPEKADLAIAPIPKYEPRTIAGNKNPYTVFGKTYYLLSTAFEYDETGIASWYGPKFHGLKTSNAEVFDMYQISAAHKTLPIPSYAKVTNLENGKTLIVRINDRGPFVGERLIDLSYAAAKRLGFVDQGKAKVRIEGIELTTSGHVMRPKQSLAPAEPKVATRAAIQVDRPPQDQQQGPHASPQENSDSYLQLGRFESEVSARAFAKQAYEKLQQSIVIHRSATTFLVALGPIADKSAIDALKQQVQLSGYSNAFTIQGLN